MSQKQIIILVIASVASLAVGYWLNTIANRENNRKLIDLLKAELLKK